MSDLIPSISNVSINSSSWTAISIPSGVNNFTKIFLRTRDSSLFYISDSATGTNYYSVGISHEFDITGSVGTPLCYVKGEGSATLEVMFRK